MKRRKFLALTAALVLAATTGLASCGNNSGNKGDTKELNMILYPDYVPQSVIDSFEKETGIKCNIDYVDNDTLIYTKWSEDPKGYDIGQPAISTLHALIDQICFKKQAMKIFQTANIFLQINVISH